VRGAARCGGRARAGVPARRGRRSGGLRAPAAAEARAAGRAMAECTRHCSWVCMCWPAHTSARRVRAWPGRGLSGQHCDPNPSPTGDSFDFSSQVMHSMLPCTVGAVNRLRPAGCGRRLQGSCPAGAGGGGAGRPGGSAGRGPGRRRVAPVGRGLTPGMPRRAAGWRPRWRQPGGARAARRRPPRRPRWRAARPSWRSASARWRRARHARCAWMHRARSPLTAGTRRARATRPRSNTG